MEKRLLLAVLLMSAVILITNILFPPVPPPEEGEAEVAERVDAADVGAPTRETPTDEPRVNPAPLVLPTQVPRAAGADSVVVASPLYRYVFSTRGAALVRAELPQYASYVEDGAPVQLVPRGTTDFLAHRIVVGGDTLDLRALPFAVSGSSFTLNEGDEPRALRFRYGTDGGFGAEITYTFRPDRYLVGVEGRVFGLGGQPAALLTEIGPALAPHEDPDHHSENELGVVAGTPDDSDILRLRKIEGTEVLEGPWTWAGIKDKYFLAALVAGERPPFTNVVARDIPDVTLEAGPGRDEAIDLPRAQATAVLPIGTDGEFGFDAYLGPLEDGRLAEVGYGLDDVNPYGYRWLRPVIRPIAAGVVWVLDLLHDNLGIAYGWVLIIFGVMMRVVLWPLNAKAMRAQMKNMAVQPMMQEVREKYKDDPQRQQQELMKMMKEHGFNPLSGCLPMLVPFPVLITLFFVFQNSIAFRGADFLWLPDLSLPDPLYLLPIFLTVSMFALQWISAHLSGMEQNPQMKMMMYFMPLFMGFIFFNFASGLNLYYATTNIASIPQQILIAKERRKAQEEMKAQNESKAAPRPPSTKRGKRGGKRRARKGKA